jgi:hypothetical protein
MKPDLGLLTVVAVKSLIQVRIAALPGAKPFRWG